MVSVQFSSVTQLYPTLRPHGLQHTRPPCPSPTPGVDGLGWPKRRPMSREGPSPELPGLQPKVCRAEPRDGRGQGGRTRSADEEGEDVNFYPEC